MKLTRMQQAVILCNLRGHDGFAKEHPSKFMVRWFRRCVLVSAFDKEALTNPYATGGGSFTGPWPQWLKFNEALKLFLDHRDEMQLHYYQHFLQAAEIVGFKHPIEYIRRDWNLAYTSLVHALHLIPETELMMDTRLGDNREAWRAREVEKELS